MLKTGRGETPFLKTKQMRTATGLNIVHRQVRLKGTRVTRVEVYTDQELKDLTFLNKVQHFIDRI